MVRFLMCSLVAASVGIVVSNVNAQNFVGPRYPGEVIISERVVTPKPEPDKSQTLPAPQTLPPPTSRQTRRTGSQDSRQSVVVKRPADNESTAEPLSLSDGGLRRNEEPRQDIPLLAFGHEVWGKMLALERENAKLEATLEYERRLATFREHADKLQETQAAEFERLKSEMKQQQVVAQRELEATRAGIAEAMRQVHSRTEEITRLERKLHQVQSSIPADKVEEIRKPLAAKLAEQSKLIRQFETRQKEMSAMIARLQQALEQAKTQIARVEKPSRSEAEPNRNRDAARKAAEKAEAAVKAAAERAAEKKEAERKEAEKKRAAKKEADAKDGKPKDDRDADSKKAGDREKMHRDEEEPLPPPNRGDEPPRGKKGRFRGAADSDQPSITLAVLPVGFSLEPTAAGDELPAPVATEENERDESANDGGGLQDDVISPLGESERPASTPEVSELPAPVGS